MPTVKELKDAIRGFKSAECPMLSKMKKNDLISFVIEKGIMSEADAKAGRGARKASSKPRKPRSKKIVKVEEVKKATKPTEEVIKKAKRQSEWQKFVQEHRKPGVSMVQVAEMWNKSGKKAIKSVEGEAVPKRKAIRKPKVASEETKAKKSHFDLFLDANPELSLVEATRKYQAENPDRFKKKTPETVITVPMPMVAVEEKPMKVESAPVKRRVKKPVVAPSLVQIAPGKVETAPRKIRKPKVAPITSGEIKKKD